MKSIFNSLEVYFDVFFDETKRIPTVVLSIDNLIGVSKDVTVEGKNFLSSIKLGIPRYTEGPQ